MAVPPLARRPHADTAAAKDVLAAARHSLSHVVAAALPVHEGEGGDLDEHAILGASLDAGDSWVCIDANSASPSFGAVWSVNLETLADPVYADGKPCVSASGDTPMLGLEDGLLIGTGMVPPPSEIGRAHV